MNGREVVKVWGTADEFDIVFTHIRGTEWICFVPPDTDDGVYAVQLYAIYRNGNMAHWVGELFMCSGVCHLSITEPDFMFLLGTDDMAIQVEEKMSNFLVAKGKVHSVIELSPALTTMMISKGCHHKKER